MIETDETFGSTIIEENEDVVLRHLHRKIIRKVCKVRESRFRNRHIDQVVSLHYIKST